MYGHRADCKKSRPGYKFDTRSCEALVEDKLTGELRQCGSQLRQRHFCENRVSGYLCHHHYEELFDLMGWSPALSQCVNINLLEGGINAKDLNYADLQCNAVLNGMYDLPFKTLVENGLVHANPEMHDYLSDASSDSDSDFGSEWETAMYSDSSESEWADETDDDWEPDADTDTDSEADETETVDVGTEATRLLDYLQRFEIIVQKRCRHLITQVENDIDEERPSKYYKM